MKIRFAPSSFDGFNAGWDEKRDICLVVWKICSCIFLVVFTVLVAVDFYKFYYPWCLDFLKNLDWSMPEGPFTHDEAGFVLCMLLKQAILIVLSLSLLIGPLIGGYLTVVIFSLLLGMFAAAGLEKLWLVEIIYNLKQARKQYKI